MTKSIASVLTLFLVFLTAPQCFAQIKALNAVELDGPIPCEQWQVVDVAYLVDEPVANPFLRDAFAVVKSIESEGVGDQKVPLFYNGIRQWVFRYSSSTVGKKTFVVRSDIKELDGKHGQIEVAKNTKPERHGGIVLNKKNPRRFFHEDGKHYLNLAFECDWLFALDYGQAEIPKTKHLLSLLSRYRFNFNLPTLINSPFLIHSRLSFSSAHYCVVH